MDESLITDQEHLCENIDICSFTNAFLGNSHVFLEKKKKRTFQENCRLSVLNSIKKFRIKFP